MALSGIPGAGAGSGREWFRAALLSGLPAVAMFLPCLGGASHVPADFWSASGLSDGPAAPRNFRNFDPVELTYPRNVSLARAVDSGAGPAWDPCPMGGLPLLADVGVGARYPPKRLALVLLPPRAAYDAMLFVHFWALGLGMWALLRGRGRSFPAALLGGMVWMLGGHVQYWFKYETALAAMAWLAPLLGAVSRLLNRARGVDVAATGLAGGLMLLCGSPYAVLFNTLIAGALAVGQAAALRRSGARLFPIVGRMSAAAALAAAIGWDQWGPTLAYLPMTSRSLDAATATSTHPRNLLLLPLLLSPRLFGGPLDRVDLVASHFPGTNINEWTGYVGLLSLACAVLAVARAPRRRWGWAAAALAAAAIAFGTPLYDVWRRLPGVGAWMTAPRLLYLYCAALTFLAAEGFDDLLTLDAAARDRLRHRLRGAWWGWIGMAAATLAAAVGASAIPSGNPIPWFAALRWLNITTPAVWMTLAAAAGALLAIGGLVRAGGPSRAAVGLSLFVAAADPAAYLFPYHAPVEARPIETPPALVDWLRAQPGGPFRVAARFEDPYWNLPLDNLLQPWEIENANGYASAFPAAYVRRFLRDGHHADRFRVEIRRMPSRLADLLNVRFVVGEGGPAAPPGVMVHRFGRLIAWENPTCLPRVWAVTNWTEAPDEDAAWQRVTDRAFDPASEAVVEGLAPASGAPATAAVRAVGGQPGSVRADVEAASPALVIFSQMHLPGWRARVDGKEATGVRVDGLLIGVPAPAGRHTVEIEYAGTDNPAFRRLGAAALWVTFAAWVTLEISGRIRRRTAPPPAV